MTEVKVVEPQFPFYGVVRRLHHGEGLALSEKPFTPWAVNVRPSEQISGRLRGGSRCGLTEFLDGTQPAFPTTDIVTEGGDQIVTEGGDYIVTEGVAGDANNAAGMAEAMRAYGITNVTAVATSGTAPTGYTLGCVYRDRLILSGSDHIVYMSRQGDFTDWNYGGDVEDAGRAFAFQCSESTEIGDTVTALIPHRDRFLLAATSKGIWAMSGDPTDDGSLKWVSRDVGVVAENAWCKVGDEIFFLSHDGLYKVNPDGSGLENVTGDKLPSELSNISTDTVSVKMGYNFNDDGIYIFLVGEDYHWVYDLNFGGFWPFTIPTVNLPDAVFEHESKLMLWDGFSKFWTVEGDDDDGTDIESHVLLGPFRFGSARSFGLLSLIQGIVDTEGTVTWSIIKAETAQDACDNAKAAVDAYVAGDVDTAAGYVAFSGDWSGGRSYVTHPRVRGMWLVVWLRSADQWAFESLALETVDGGGWR